MRHVVVLSLALATIWPALASAGGRTERACAASLPERLAPGGASRQLVTVVAKSTRATTASLQLWQRDSECWRSVGGPWRARVGRNGLSTDRHEGDGTTPLGTFGFLPTMYGVAANPGVRYRYHQLVCGDWWDADPASRTYNRFRHVACNAKPPFAAASEPLWRYPSAYRHFVALDFNTKPVGPGRGSAMFLHADTGRATAGCVSIALPHLVQTLRWLDPDAQPRVAIAVAK
jgi:L,D-peptidoglycan transpeptidase YkuD (ErfK/YbiS/YcfS/YnhG family)